MIGPNGRVRLRIRFAKLGKIRWTSHRDLARMWERAFRRVDLPLAYSEGFSPRPRVSFGLALPTGHESVAEFLDVDLTSLDEVDVASLAGRLSEALPVGVDATAVAVLAPGTPSLQEEVTSCSWRWTAVNADGSPLSAATLGSRVAEVLAAPAVEVLRTRKGVEAVEDIRPGILDLRVEEESTDGVVLTAELAVAPRAIRPADVLSALGPGLEERQVRRTSQWILRHGARREPLDAAPDDATAAPHALERAS
jgi:radical SAM-linked protein